MLYDRSLDVFVFSELILDPSGSDGSRSLDGQSEGSSPDQVGHASQGSTDSEDHCVVLEFAHSEVVQQDS